jgi:hypothetical protein
MTDVTKEIIMVKCPDCGCEFDAKENEIPVEDVSESKAEADEADE